MMQVTGATRVGHSKERALALASAKVSCHQDSADKPGVVDANEGIVWGEG